MKRKATNKISDWFQNDSQPLYLYGIPGAGKTWLCNEFISSCNRALYFKTEADMEQYSSDPLNFVASFFDLSSESLANTVLVIDDSHRAPIFSQNLFQKAVLNNFKWIFVSRLTADSYIAQNATVLKIRPLDFDEFLINIGEEWYVSTMIKHFNELSKLPDMVHEDLLSCFEEYLFVGGMPQVLNEYINNHNQGNVSKCQENALILCEDSLKSIIDPSERYKAEQVFKLIDKTLKHPNQKFMYSNLRKGATYAQYSMAISELEKLGLIMPLYDHENETRFKLYFSEFSLSLLHRYNEVTDVEWDCRFENYLRQELFDFGIQTYFWESNRMAELKFLIKNNSGIIPIELNEKCRNDSRSISSFKRQFECSKTLCFSNSNFVVTPTKITLPYYSCFCLENKQISVF